MSENACKLAYWSSSTTSKLKDFLLVYSSFFILNAEGVNVKEMMFLLFLSAHYKTFFIFVTLYGYIPVWYPSIEFLLLQIDEEFKNGFAF